MKITPRMRNVRWLYDIWMVKSLPLEIVFSKTEFLENAWYLRKNIVLCVTTIASFLAHDFLHKVGKVSFFVLLGTMKTRLIWKKKSMAARIKRFPNVSKQVKHKILPLRAWNECRSMTLKKRLIWKTFHGG